MSDVLPSIIVLAITALLVFRRELTTRPATPASKPMPDAKRRPLHQSKSTPDPAMVRQLDPLRRLPVKSRQRS